MHNVCSSPPHSTTTLTTRHYITSTSISFVHTFYQEILDSHRVATVETMVCSRRPHKACQLMTSRCSTCVPDRHSKPSMPTAILHYNGLLDQPFDSSSYSLLLGEFVFQRPAIVSCILATAKKRLGSGIHSLCPRVGRVGVV